MSEALQPNFIRSLRFTPLSDLIRGKLSARLDARTRVMRSDLPEEARTLLLTTLSHLRLDRSEKLSVADDLMAHFRDGMDADQSIAELVDFFGDPRTVAKLLTRGKRRQRSLFRHLITALKRTVLGLMALYAVTAVHFFSGEASPSINFAQRINNRLPPAVPEASAWPIYAHALPAHFMADDFRIDVLTDAQPGSAEWEALKQALAQADLPAVREASRRPVLGYRFQENARPADSRSHVRPIQLPSSEKSGPPLASEYVGPLSRLSLILAADGRVATVEGDFDRVLADFATLDRIADQLGPYPASDLQSLMIRKRATSTLQLFLKSPALSKLSDDRLIAIAHDLSRHREASDLVLPNDHRPTFYDLIQRIYTDDGHGDGHLTPDVAQQFFAERKQFNDYDVNLLMRVALPTAPLTSPSRREVEANYERLLAIASSTLAHPMRDADWTPFVHALNEWHQASVIGMEEIGVAGLMPQYWRLHAAAERYLGDVDGSLIAIALELYRREHGQFPATLQDLSPHYLPELPVDRITGGPLRYHLVDGQPLVYSVGVDRDDDGGVPLVPRWSWTEATAAEWVVEPSDERFIVDGDWLLYATAHRN